MYSKHAVQFDRLIEEGMPISQVHVLKSILTNPDVDLEHNGTVKITGTLEGTHIRAAKWAKCETNWEYDSIPPSQGGGTAYVYAKDCDGPSGANVTGDLKKIFLPVAPSQDPNVVAGDVITYSPADGDYYIASGYGDFMIGTVINSTRIENALSGWGLVNGTDNTVAKGGSGIDGRDKFLRQWNSSSDAGNSGGSASSNLTIEGTITANGIGNHSHTLNESTIGTGSEGTVTVITGTPTGDSGVDLGTISVSFTGASGSGSPSAATVPPYVYVATYERLDNSRNKVG